MKKRFPDELIDKLRKISLEEVAEALSYYCKVDTRFVPIKDKKTKLYNIVTPRGEFHIIVTGEKWFDEQRKVGGGGAIDLIMHITKFDFVRSVKVLNDIWCKRSFDPWTQRYS